jgi:hypothetical protein
MKPFEACYLAPMRTRDTGLYLLFYQWVNVITPSSEGGISRKLTLVLKVIFAAGCATAWGQTPRLFTD